MVLLATFVVAVPTAVAQSPLGDQYSTVEAVPGDDSGTTAAVQVRDVSAASTESLPFTGGQISLIALIGLGLVALGVVGVTTTRQRGSSIAE